MSHYHIDGLICFPASAGGWGDGPGCGCWRALVGGWGLSVGLEGGWGGSGCVQSRGGWSGNSVIIVIFTISLNKIM